MAANHKGYTTLNIRTIYTNSEPWWKEVVSCERAAAAERMSPGQEVSFPEL